MGELIATRSVAVMGMKTSELPLPLHLAPSQRIFVSRWDEPTRRRFQARAYQLEFEVKMSANDAEQLAFVETLRAVRYPVTQAAEGSNASTR